jgi:hypothetical protein
MSNNLFHNPQSIERSLKHVHLEVAIAAVGAPTLTRGIGITSITRTGAGLYSIVLPKFNSFVSAHFTHILATAEASSVQVTAVNPAAGTISIMTKVAGIAADLTSGSILMIDLQYKNTSVSK